MIGSEEDAVNAPDPESSPDAGTESDQDSQGQDVAVYVSFYLFL